MFLSYITTPKNKRKQNLNQGKNWTTTYIYNQWSCNWRSGFSLSAGNWLKSCPFTVMWESESPKLPSAFDHQTAYFSILAVYQKHNENSWCFKQPDWFAISGYLTILLNEAEYDVKKMQGGSYLLRFKAEKMDHYEVDKWTEAKKAQHFLTGGVAMYIFLMILLKALTCKGVKLWCTFSGMN